MRGLNYITDEKGNRIAVQLDLKKHKKLWEDVYDAMLVDERKKELRMDWEEAKKKLRAKN